MTRPTLPEIREALGPREFAFTLALVANESAGIRDVASELSSIVRDVGPQRALEILAALGLWMEEHARGEG